MATSDGDDRATAEEKAIPRPGQGLPSEALKPDKPGRALDELQHAPQAFRRGLPLATSIAMGLVLTGIIAWLTSHVGWFFLLIYLAFVLATVLNGPVSWLGKHHISRGIATVAIMMGLVLLVAAILYFASGYITAQATQVMKNLGALPKEYDSWLKGMEKQHPDYAHALRQVRSKELYKSVKGSVGGSGVFSGLFGEVSAGVAVATYTLVVFFVTMYMSIDGVRYMRSARRILPKDARLEASRAFESMSTAHRGWFFSSMANVASSSTLNTIGLTILGVPGSLMLGIIAGCGELVPNIGPGLAAIPAILVALVTPGLHVWEVLVMFVITMNVQGYTISPLVLKHGVSIPPLVTIIAVLVMAILFGVLGIVVAVPLTADLVVLWNYWNEKFSNHEEEDHDTVNAPPAPRHRRFHFSLRRRRALYPGAPEEITPEARQGVRGL